MSSSATLTINVIDAQDTPPSFIGTPYFGYVYEISVPVSKKTSLSDFLLNSLQPFCKVCSSRVKWTRRNKTWQPNVVDAIYFYIQSINRNQQKSPSQHYLIAQL